MAKKHSSNGAAEQGQRLKEQPVSLRNSHIWSKFIVLVFLPVIFSSAGFLFGNFFSSKKPAVSSADQLVFKHHHLSRPAKLHEAATVSDLCPLLAECYCHSDSGFQGVERCERTLSTLFRYYDSSALYDKDTPVAFASFFSDRDNNGNRMLHIYNVCVHPSWRSRGVASRLIKEGIEEMVSFHNLDTSRLLIGLDIDNTSPMPAEAFALYAKMGFLRGWQPCSSVGNIDWRLFFNEPTHPAVQSSITDLMADPSRFQKQIIKGNGRAFLPLRTARDEKPQDRDHFCMFKFYNDSWLAWGEIIAAPITRSPVPRQLAHRYPKSPVAREGVA